MTSATKRKKDVSSLSFAKKKRSRVNLGHREEEVIAFPNLLQTQVESYKAFLQADKSPEERIDVGLHAAFKSVLPIVSYSGHAELDYVSYRLDAPVFDVQECKLRGLTLAAPLKVKMRLTIYDKESPNEKIVQDVREQEVFMGEVPLMTDTGSLVINGTERVVVSQLHRSPGVFFEHDKGKTHSSGKLLYSARIIPYRGSWLDFEFDPKDCVYVRIDRRRKIPATVLLRALEYTTDEILELFYSTNVYHFDKDGVVWEMVPEYLRGEMAAIDIKNSKGDVIIEKGRRVSARHIKLIQEAGLKELNFDDEYIIGKVLAHDVVDKETGEVIAHANDIVTQDVIDQMRGAKIKTIETLYINEIECGPYVSDTLRIDNSTNKQEALVEIYRIMRPGEPPTKDASEALFANLFFNP